MLKAIAPSETAELNSGDRRCLLPLTIADLADLYAANPQARLLAGGTDLALEVTQFHRELPVMIYVGHVGEMKRIEVCADRLEIGAATPLTDCYEALAADYPDFGELLHRFASLQIRNQGTLGGNIGNASPIGDSPPLLIALGARLVLRKGVERRRELPLEEYFIDYKVTARKEGEFIEQMIIPRPQPSQAFRAYKVSKRLDDDISAVCAAISLTVENCKITAVRTGSPSAAWPRFRSAPRPAKRRCSARAFQQRHLRTRRGRPGERLRPAHRLPREQGISPADRAEPAAQVLPGAASSRRRNPGDRLCLTIASRTRARKS